MGRPGQIVTFYSYKGGTGRSMLLANVAWILASNGHRVLVIDWDLEAPGLHRFFRPFLPDVDLHETEGVIDFMLDFSVAAITPTGEGGSDDSTWFHPYADLTAYTVPLHWDFPGDGRLDFVGAGRQGPSYSSRVNGFNWQEFYDRFGGGALLDRMREVLKSRYDYIIVDSRTGISDTSGICTVQLPDVLVVCFTLNNQSVEGASAVARSVQAQTNGAVRILPVPTRVERSEKDKLNLRREDAMRRFGPLLEGVTRGERDEYWTDVEVLYEPYYAYEEILATFKDRPGERHTILASAEHLATRVVGETVRALHVSEGRRQAVLANYEGVPVRAAPVQGRDLPGVFIGYQRTEGGYAGKLYDRLVRTFGADRTFIDVSTLEPGADVATEVFSADWGLSALSGRMRAGQQPGRRVAA